MTKMMRGILILLAVLVAAPATAAPLVMNEPARFDATPGVQPGLRFEAVRIDISYPAQRTIGDQIATRLGVRDGTAELFHYRVEEASSESTSLDGGINGNGFRLKLSW
jgi:hypothetical protein